MIYAKLVNNWEKYILHSGTIIMACSGQKYGILGRAIMLTEVPVGFESRLFIEKKHGTVMVPCLCFLLERATGLEPASVSLGS